MKSYVPWLVVAAVTIFLGVTNPTQKDFADYTKQQVGVPGRADNPLRRAAQHVASQMAEADSLAGSRRQNYVLFSVFTYQGAFTGMERERYVGAASMFFKLR